MPQSCWIKNQQDNKLNPETTSGGRGLLFYASIRVNIRAGEKIPDPNCKNEFMGHIINARVVKNKTARPYKVASFSLLYGIGVDKVAEIADIAILLGAIDKGGAWLRIKGEDDKPITRKWINSEGEKVETVFNFQGKEKLIEHIRKDIELYNLLERVVYGETISLSEYRGEEV